MKFKDFLENTPEYDGELYIKNSFESEFGFVWDKSLFVFTKFGKLRFKKILNSEVILNKVKNLELQDETISEEDYRLFMFTQSGYVPNDFFMKCFKEV